ncbi:MAG TPA: hypothetical protein VGI78_10265 [Acetobacteraceae bacterium]
MMDVAENHFARASKDRTSLFDGWSDRIGRQTGRMLRLWLDSGTDAMPPPAKQPTRGVVTQVAPVASAPRKMGSVEYRDDDIPPLDATPKREPSLQHRARAKMMDDYDRGRAREEAERINDDIPPLDDDPFPVSRPATSTTRCDQQSGPAAPTLADGDHLA